MIRGIGIDVVDVDRFRRLLRNGGDRFAAHWFAPDEVARCAAGRDAGAALAEHYAVKEAVWKALDPGAWSGPLPWRTIVFRPSDGTVTLSGRPAELAGSAAVHASTVRLAHAVLATVLVEDATC